MVLDQQSLELRAVSVTNYGVEFVLIPITTYNSHGFNINKILSILNVLSTQVKTENLLKKMHIEGALMSKSQNITVPGGNILSEISLNGPMFINFK